MAVLVNNGPKALLACFSLASAYVLSLYVWNTPTKYNRDDPAIVKRRFVSVFVMMIASPIFTYTFCDVHEFSIFEILGLRLPGIFQAATTSLLLTVVLFLGPLAMQMNSDWWNLYSEPRYWLANFKNLIWLRNYIVAPLSEELTFRACMLPLLVQYFSNYKAIFISPIFFGLAHFHHVYGRVKGGVEVRKAVLMALLQFSYSTIFGAYSAYLFLRTGHFTSAFVAHAFCNSMGFPNFSLLLQYNRLHGCLIIILSLIGVFFWLSLLEPITNPAWYKNSLYWIKD